MRHSATAIQLPSVPLKHQQECHLLKGVERNGERGNNGKDTTSVTHCLTHGVEDGAEILEIQQQSDIQQQSCADQQMPCRWHFAPT